MKVQQQQLRFVVEQSHAGFEIQILEEPMEFGYRFRYEVEGKAHGGIQAASSSQSNRRTRKLYPTIQVSNTISLSLMGFRH